MHVELIGCTGAGKSTLVSRLAERYRARGVPVVTGHDLVLRTVGLGWVRHRLARTLLTDAVAGLACLFAWPTHAPFFRFALRTIVSLPGSWFRRLNTARNVFKNVGIWEIARRRSGDGRVVLVDEGTLHTAHYLFVHLSVGVPARGIETFARLVPLPDVAIYVRPREDVLVERTVELGHRRIPDGSPAVVRRFVGHAVQAFDLLAEQPAVRRRLLVLDPGQTLSVGSVDTVAHAPVAGPADDIRRPGKDGTRWSSG